MPTIQRSPTLNKLSLNIVKAQVMIIGSAQMLGQINKISEITPCFQVKGNEIELLHETKYLGVMIDKNLKWGSQVTFLQKKISRALGLFKICQTICTRREVKEQVFKYR